MSYWGKCIYIIFIYLLLTKVPIIGRSDLFDFPHPMGRKLKVETNGSGVDKSFMAMFVGFMDGDGYFDIGRQSQTSKKGIPAEATIRIRFAVNLHPVDLPLLQYFQFR
jgi:hypothetical protein